MSENGHTLIEIPSSLTVRDLAERIAASPIDVIKQLMANGVMANINQQIDYDTAAIVIAEFGYEAQPQAAPQSDVEELVELPHWRRLVSDEEPSTLVTRPPVVTILGHVDHGKTTLLDAIRKTDVAAGEAGGITQHIGAYQVRHHDRLITFLDTPGHAAFTAIAPGVRRATLPSGGGRDDVMPQIAGMAHARAARVPLVVALNKVDKSNANPDRVKQELSDLGLIPDDWDGETMVVPVSAKQGQGIDDLLEAVLLVADSNKIQANPEGKVLGTVIEAELDKTKGVMATLLVQNGTLRLGDTVLVGTASGRVRAMFDYQGNPLEEAGPSVPVAALGLSDVPKAGELFLVVDSEREAKATIVKRLAQSKEAEVRPAALSLEQVFAAFQAGEAKALKLVVKADVQGSLEPIVSSLEELNVGGIGINVLHAATGNIGENDVMLAAASGAVIIGFNVTADGPARRVAEVEGVDVRLYDVIYRLTEDIEKARKGMLEPEKRMVDMGRAEVLQVFRIPKVGFIAGCRVMQGEIRRNARMRVVRGKEAVYDGNVSSLRHEKDDVREVREGFECGIAMKGFDDFAVGDQLIAYTEETVAVE
jgi:translation initiation factor IF-2